MIGGYQNNATATASVTAGGEFNIAADPVSTIAAGCDNIIGSIDVPANSCDTFSGGLSGTKAGDTLLLSFPNPPPDGLVIRPEGVDSSNDIVFSGCNHTGSEIDYDNQLVNYMTLR